MCARWNEIQQRLQQEAGHHEAHAAENLLRPAATLKCCAGSGCIACPCLFLMGTQCVSIAAAFDKLCRNGSASQCRASFVS